MRINHCKSCTYKINGPALNEISCALTQRKIEPESYCDMHTISPTICTICNHIIPDRKGYIITTQDNMNILICEDCFYSLNTCKTCKNIKCGVQSDTSGRPKQVQQQIQQGSMTMVTTVPNPELLKEYCPTCSCFENERCNREYNGCNNYDTVIS